MSVSRLYDPPGEGEVTDAACRLADTALLCYRASDVASLQQAVTKVGVATIIISAANRSIGYTTGCTITEKAPTRAFSSPG